KEILGRKCNCENPKKSHKWCSVDIETEYSTFDAWYVGYSDNVMVYPERIREIADELDCPFKLLNDEKTRGEIIDWVDTAERLQWCEPPEKRKYFIEKSIFDDKPDVFNPDSSYGELFDIFCDSIRNQTDERKKIDLLLTVRSMIDQLGTSKSYRTLRLNDNNQYYIPSLDNKESLDYLKNLLENEGSDKDKNFIQLLSIRCRCEGGTGHNGFIAKFVSPEEIETLCLQKQVKNIISLDKIKEILGD